MTNTLTLHQTASTGTHRKSLEDSETSSSTQEEESPSPSEDPDSPPTRPTKAGAAHSDRDSTSSEDSDPPSGPEHSSESETEPRITNNTDSDAGDPARQSSASDSESAASVLASSTGPPDSPRKRRSETRSDRDQASIKRPRTRQYSTGQRDIPQLTPEQRSPRRAGWSAQRSTTHREKMFAKGLTGNRRPLSEVKSYAKVQNATKGERQPAASRKLRSSDTEAASRGSGNVPPTATPTTPTTPGPPRRSGRNRQTVPAATTI